MCKDCEVLGQMCDNCQEITAEIIAFMREGDSEEEFEPCDCMTDQT